MARGAFYSTSVLAFGMAIILYVFVPKDNSTQRSHATINQSTVDGIADKPLERQTKPSSLAALVRNRNVLILSLSYTCEGYVLFIFVFWLYIFLVEVRGFTILSGGMAASLLWITALAMTLLGGWTCDRITRSKGRLAGARTVIMIGYGLSGVLLFGAA